MNNFRISIVAKIFFGYVAVILALSALIFFFSFRITRRHYIRSLASDMHNMGVIFREELVPLLEAGETARVDSLSKRLGEETHTRITVVGLDGTVLADSHRDPAGMESHADRPEILRALKGFRSRELRYSTTLEEEMLYVALPVESGERLIGVARLSLSLKDINVLLRTLAENTLFPAGGLIVAVSLVAALLISRALARPIMDLAAASRKVAAGDYDVTVSFPVNGEMRELQESFNLMTGRVKTLVSELSRQKEWLDRVIASIREGLAVIGPDGEVLLANPAFREMVGAGETRGLSYREAIGADSLVEFIRRRLAEGTGGTGEAEIGGRICVASGAFAGPEGELVVVLYDITELRRCERAQRDLLVNVSHELKTPLTAIKGYADTLAEGSGDGGRCLEVIRRQTDRLIAVVNDLLLLARLEEGKVRPEPEPVDPGTAIREALELFRPRLAEKKLEARLRLADDLPRVTADRRELGQVLVNLIDNAVKFTESGHIGVSAAVNEGRLEIAVEDTGAGIPPADLERVWERFYLADRSRSRRRDGAGLGLAIARRIVLLHRGTIRIESDPGRSTRVVLTLPLES